MRASACSDLERAVEHVQRRLVTELAERLGDFVLDFFLVERSRQRRLLGGGDGARLLRLFPAIVDDENVECAHAAGDYKANSFAPQRDCSRLKIVMSSRAA